MKDFDIVITDIKMPIMTGIELAGWIYQNKPDTKVIIVSGYSVLNSKESIGI